MTMRPTTNRIKELIEQEISLKKDIILFSLSIFSAFVANGKETIDCENSLFMVSQEKLYGAIDKAGKIVIPIDYEKLDLSPFHGIAECKPPFPAKLPGGKYGYIDLKNKWVIAPQFESAGCFTGESSQSVASVKKGGSQFFLIDNKGTKIGDSWDSLITNSNKMPFVARRKNKITYLDSSGKVLFDSPNGPLNLTKTKFKYDNFLTSSEFGFSEGLAPFKKKNRWGMIDLNGKIVISPQFDISPKFGSSFSIVTIGENAGIIDKSGKYLLKPQKVSILDFQCDNDGLICGMQTLHTYEFRIFDLSKQTFLPRIFSGFNGCNEKICIVQEQKDPYSQYTAIDINGKRLFKFPKTKGYVLPFHEGLAAFSYFKENGADPYLLGFVNKDGIIEIKPQFENATSKFTCGLARVDIGHRVGWINKKGDYVWNPR